MQVSRSDAGDFLILEVSSYELKKSSAEDHASAAVMKYVRKKRPAAGRVSGKRFLFIPIPTIEAKNSYSEASFAK